MRSVSNHFIKAAEARFHLDVLSHDCRELFCGSRVRAQHFHSQGPGFNPGWGTKTAEQGQKKKKFTTAQQKPNPIS